MHARAILRHTGHAIAATLVALFATACEHNPSAVGTLASITITRNPDTLGINAAGRFTATGRDANGSVVGIVPAWTVSAGGGVITSSANNSGVFTAGGVLGTFTNTVTATVGSVSGRATVTVVAGPAASITITPTPATLVSGTAQLFTPVVRDAAGNVLALVPTWSVAAGGGTITAAGMFTAGATAGTYTNTVTASVGGIAGTATVIVTGSSLASISISPNPAVLTAGGPQLFVATGRDGSGNVVPLAPTWSVQAGGGTITAAGTFTAGTVAGTYANTVRACSTPVCGAGSISGYATVIVSSGVLASITVMPDPVDVGTGASVSFTAVGRDGSGNVIPIVPAATWTVRVGYSGGTVGSAGLYTAPGAVGVGFDSVRATSGAIFGSARANVKLSGPLVSIAVTPNPATIALGGTAAFTATGFDATGLIVPTPGLSWAVVAGGGTIGAGTGVFTAGLVAGTYLNTVRATSGSVSGFATVIEEASVAFGPSLGGAETHGILAGSAITCAAAPGVINADVSVWPGSAITGFPPCTITGARHVADAFAQNAQSDLTTAFLALAAMPCGTTITANLGGTTLAPGVYCSLSSVGVTGVVTLAGPATAVWVIRAPSTLTTAGSVVLSGGALAKNVYWWVGSSATLGTGSGWQGNILALTSVTLVDNVTLTGRALARNGAVALGTNSVITLP